jgi:hypothetical protein
VSENGNNISKDPSSSPVIVDILQTRGVELKAGDATKIANSETIGINKINLNLLRNNSLFSISNYIIVTKIIIS